MAFKDGEKNVLKRYRSFIDNAQHAADFAVDEKFLKGLDRGKVNLDGTDYEVGALGNLMVGVMSEDLGINPASLMAGGLAYSLVNTVFGAPLAKAWANNISDPKERAYYKQNADNLTNNPLEEIKDSAYYVAGRNLAKKQTQLTIEDITKALKESTARRNRIGFNKK
jgi:hypothetical protein